MLPSRPSVLLRQITRIGERMRTCELWSAAAKCGRGSDARLLRSGHSHPVSPGVGRRGRPQPRCQFSEQIVRRAHRHAATARQLGYGLGACGQVHVDVVEPAAPDLFVEVIWPKTDEVLTSQSVAVVTEVS